ncbi:hypothetical protein PoMZ_13485, partial [Pyricularia oryzae]
LCIACLAYPFQIAGTVIITRNTRAKNEGLLFWIKDFSNGLRADIHFLFTSRPERDIESALNQFVNHQIPIQSDLVAEDICAFRWVSYQFDFLENCLKPHNFRAAFKKLPKTLDEIYARILSKIPPNYKRNVTKFLQFFTFSERPLQFEEIVDINAVDLEKKPKFNTDYKIPEPNEIFIYCSSLVIVSNKSDKYGNIKKKLQFAHFLVKEYLKSKRLETKMSPHFEEGFVRQWMAEVCLAYLLDISHDLTAVKIRKDWPLVQYAARYWISHAAYIGPNAKEFKNLVEEFVQSEKSHQICFGLYNPEIPWSGPKFNSCKKVKTPLLYYMAAENVLCGVHILIDKGTDVNAQGGYYGNALYAASSEGHKTIVQILIDKGADVNAQGGLYGNAFQAALSRCYNKIVQMLVHNGAFYGK